METLPHCVMCIQVKLIARKKEYAGGKDLHDYINQRGEKIHSQWKIVNSLYFPRDTCGGLPSFMTQNLSGLSHLHSHNIVHQDMKLENLLLTASKSCILIADLQTTPKNERAIPASSKYFKSGTIKSQND
eukprot:1295442-Ditylum_brightwellii.AAC.1